MMSHERNRYQSMTMPGLDFPVEDGVGEPEGELSADVFGNKVLPLNALDPLPARESLEDASNTLAQYFEKVLQKQQMATGCYILMPSLNSLARFFDVPLNELRKAFWKLKRHGYDFVMPGDYGNISVWPNPSNRSSAS